MNKTYTTIVKVKVKSFDSVSALIHEVANIMANETDKGMIEKEDGDKVEWSTDIK